MAYENATICLNGHILSKYKAKSQKFCSKCGKETYSFCLQCNAPIRGVAKLEGVVVLGDRAYDKPFYCYNCGAAYPWTESALKNAALLIQEEDELSDQLKQSIVESLPDIITETPGTNLATVRVKKCLASAGRFTADAIRQFVIDFGCELAKKSLEI